jgi:S-ribosylhomocysteine lyase LuxS involved in autoinducer biosynthesis
VVADRQVIRVRVVAVVLVDTAHLLEHLAAEHLRNHQ